MQRRKNHGRKGMAMGKTFPKRAQRAPISARRNRPRRCGIARLRSAFFARGYEGATRYSVLFERVLRHLWTARRANRGVTLRHVTHIEDLVLAVGCIDGDSRAWSDLAEQYERSLVRRGRDCPEELETTVQVRKFIAVLRQDALAGRSAMVNYTGSRALRAWMNENFAATRQRSRRAAFVLDPADSCCGTPLRFTPTGADG